MKTYLSFVIVLIAFFGSLYAASFVSNTMLETLQRSPFLTKKIEKINAVDDIDILKELHVNLLKQNALLKEKILSDGRLVKRQHYGHAIIYLMIFITLLFGCYNNLRTHAPTNRIGRAPKAKR